jgi:hypothetical protein
LVQGVHLVLLFSQLAVEEHPSARADRHSSARTPMAASVPILAQCSRLLATA